MEELLSREDSLTRVAMVTCQRVISLLVIRVGWEGTLLLCKDSSSSRGRGSREQQERSTCPG